VEASTLRWILIIVGVLIVGSIFLFGNPERKKKPKASRRAKRGAERREPTLGGEGQSDAVAEPGDEDEGGEPSGQGELDIGSGAAEADAPAAGAGQAPAGPRPEKITSLFLLARDNHLINGAELLQAAVSTGMEFGEMNIFHRLPEGSGKAVFSLANASKPGHFERDEWNAFETQGVVLFMTLPGPVDALDAWDAMLATARRMSEILQADILDGERNPFTRQKEAQIREEMRAFDRGKSGSG
jgi:cell division protein ZipA